jgi:hypothetical protein
MYGLVVIRLSIKYNMKLCIGGVDVTVKKIPTTIQIILLKKMQFYSESNWFKPSHKIWFEFTDLKINFLI